jgi:hypothetical protein
MYSVEDGGNYEPGSGDLIAFTNIRPKSLDDLNIPTILAMLIGQKKDFQISSKCLKKDTEHDLGNREEPKLYAVYLMNLTTNLRISNALNSPSEGEHLNIIKTVLGPHLIVRITFLIRMNFSFISYVAYYGTLTYTINPRSAITVKYMCIVSCKMFLH